MTTTPAPSTAPGVDSRRWPTVRLTRLTDRPERRVLLYCVPPTGAGPEFFRPWVPLCAGFIDLTAAELPGRGARTGEPSITDIQVGAAALADAIAADLRRDPDGLYALFGHSFGGLLAFETIRRLRRFHHTAPKLLAISASPAPQLNALRQYVATHLGSGIGTLATVMGWTDPVDGEWDPSLVETVYTPFLADALALLQHTHRDEPPLDTRIRAFGGRDDPIVPPESLTGWDVHSTTEVSVRPFPGGHHYLHTQLPAFLSQLTHDLLQACRGA
ncbi:thioesterase II family protein [Streptomyces sp. NPDC101776]|uniref:thioesterase II family protein n=1 Tax=Streptomyces sp. NPDC101776 TaxID=3366146 RepID=UPI0037FB7BBA